MPARQRAPLSAQIAARAIETLGAGMKRRSARRLLARRADLREIERPVIVGRDGELACLDRFAERISELVGHIGMDDHRPAGEIDGVYRMLETGQAGLRQARDVIARGLDAAAHRAFDRQDAEAALERELSPAQESFIEDRVERTGLDELGTVGMA